MLSNLRPLTTAQRTAKVAEDHGYNAGLPLCGLHFPDTAFPAQMCEAATSENPGLSYHRIFCQAATIITMVGSATIGLPSFAKTVRRGSGVLFWLLSNKRLALALPSMAMVLHIWFMLRD